MPKIVRRYYDELEAEHDPDAATYLEPLGPMCWINIYRVQRHYGGPEEGGWWFNSGEAFRSIRVPLRHRDAVLARVWDACTRANEGAPPLSSVASSGIWQAELERGPAVDWPRERPQYS